MYDCLHVFESYVVHAVSLHIYLSYVAISLRIF